MPAAKRRATLGGGSGDIKPQYLTVTLAPPAGVDDYTVVIVQAPGVGLTAPVGHATVMEILGVDWYFDVIDIGDAGKTCIGFLAANTARSTDSTVTLASLDVDIAQPSVFGAAFMFWSTVTTGGLAQNFPIHIDTTDGNGNGMIYAARQFVAVVGCIGNTAAMGGTVKILYRLTFMKSEEFIGILASQTIPITAST